MDFSVAGSESWGSTSREDIFIENYFRKTKQSMSNIVASKNKKKSSKLSDNLVEPAKKKKCLTSKAVTYQVSVTNTYNEAQAKEMDDVDYSKSKTSKTNNVSPRSMKSKPKKSTNKPQHASLELLNNLNKKAKKGILKTNETAKTSCENVPIPLKVTSFPHSKNTLKRKKSKKNLKNSQDTSELSFQNTNISSKTSSSDNKNIKMPVKLASISKDSTNSEDESSEYNFSEDGESDEEVLREEIQNSSVFKQIRKLMKKAPHLNPSLEHSEFAECSPASPDVNDLADDSSEWSVTALSEEGSDDDLSVVTDEEDAESVESDSQVPDVNFERTTNKQNHSMKQVGQNTDSKTSKNDETVNRTSPIKNKKQETSNNLRNKAQMKLAAAKFRYLNEKLYTETGKEAFGYFQDNEEEFKDYHIGYSLQVSKWPMNPVNEIISDLQKLKKTLVIADLGCGDAKIAQTFPDRIVHSFDLVPLNEFVKACDISKVPLPNESVDVVVFCLSLMGVNLKEYLCEAFRILKLGGILKIAEVESRVEDLDHFTKCLKSIGFTLQKQNTKHKIFVFLDLKKEKKKCKSKKVPDISLKPCLYKKR